MATHTDTVVLELQAKLDKYHADIMKGQRAFDTTMSKFEKSMKSVESQSVRSFSKMTTALTAFAGALSVNELRLMADGWTDYSSRVGLAIGNMDAAPVVMDRLYQMAQKTYSELGTTVEGFLAFSTSLKEIGLTTSESLDFVEAFNNAMVVSGAKAERAAMVQNALGKAMASGKLSGDELNTVIESGGRLAELLAERMGTTVGGLRKLGQEGKITSNVIREVFSDNFQKLEEEAASMPATISDGFMKIRNALQMYVGTADQSLGITSKIAEALVFLSDNFEAVATGAAAAGGFLASAYIPSLVRTAAAQAAVIATNPFLLAAAAIAVAVGALVAFGDEIKPIEGDMGSLTDYAVTGFKAMVDSLAAARTFMTEAFSNVVDSITESLEGTGLSWEGMLDTAKSVVNTTVGVFTGLREVVVTLFTSIPNVIGEGVVGAMIYMVEKVQEYLNKVISGINTLIEGMNSVPGVNIGAIGEAGFADGLTNPFEGSTRDMADSIRKSMDDALSRDYIDEAVGAVSDAIKAPLEAWRAAANENAAAREAQAEADKAAADAVLNQPPPTPGGAGGASGSGGKGKKGSEDAFQKALADKNLEIDALRREAEALAALDPYAKDYEENVRRMRIEQELLNKAHEAGVTVTPEVLAGVKQLAASYDEAEQAAERLREKHEFAQRQIKEWQDTQEDSMKGFIRDMAKGKSATEALGSAVGKLADKLLDMALDSMFMGGFGGGGGGLFGSALGALGGLFGFRASGGPVKAGSPYFINENTPNSELFVPSQNGAVLNVPQAQQALRTSLGVAGGLSADKVASAPTQVVQSHTSITIDVAGANGDAAIEAAVNAGIRKAAPAIRKQATTDAVKRVGQISRSGSKEYLGFG